MILCILKFNTNRCSVLIHIDIFVILIEIIFKLILTNLFLIYSKIKYIGWRKFDDCAKDMKG